MKFKKPKFWDYNKPNILSYLFFPVSLLLTILKTIKNLTTKKKKYSKIKTICVGNIYLGGTGKTSLSLKINEILKDKIKTCFIKKYYSDQIDEQKILSNHGKLFKFKDRSSAIKQAIDENFELAIFDDGLQDSSIDYDYRIACFNIDNWIGNGFTIPAGPLRENIKNLRKYKKLELVDLFNLSVNNTLSRTIMTSLTTLLALVSLFIFGGEVIRPFALTMIIGVIIGTYSSVFIAVPTLLIFKFRPQDEDD